nr:hypothetical protein [Tanacetum cinerariifolium]
AILDTYGESTILKRRRKDDDQEGPSARPNRRSKRQKGGEQASASTPSKKATKGAGGSTTGTQSRQQSTSQSAYAEEPVQTTCQMEETPLPVYETGADEQLIVQTSQHPEWFSQPRKPPSPDRAWNAALPRRREEDDDQEGPSARSDRGSKRQREGGEHASASTSSKPATGSAGRSTTGTQSRQLSASESAFTEEPMQTTCQMEEPSHSMFETGAEDQPIVQTSQHPEWFS